MVLSVGLVWDIGEGLFNDGARIWTAPVAIKWRFQRISTNLRRASLSQNRGPGQMVFLASADGFFVRFGEGLRCFMRT